MTYWRMQLNPAEHGRAMEHTVTSLAAGYIGLDFEPDVGDLKRGRKNYLRDSVIIGLSLMK